MLKLLSHMTANLTELHISFVKFTKYLEETWFLKLGTLRVLFGVI